jgi:leucine efflux protein
VTAALLEVAGGVVSSSSWLSLSSLGISNYWGFVVAVLVFLAIPGPGTFACLTAVARGGLRGGYAALTGLIVGDWCLMLSAILGLAALLKANPTWFHAIQWLGAAYLIWIGIQLLRTRDGGINSLPEAMQPGPGKYFRQGLLITLINPKAIVFYMAFFPLFIDPAHPIGPPTFVAMAATVTLLTLFYGSLILFLGHGVVTRLKQHRWVGQFAMKLAGLAMCAFGVKMATQ